MKAALLKYMFSPVETSFTEICRFLWDHKRSNIDRW